MSLDDPTYARGKELSEQVNPGMEDAWCRACPAWSSKCLMALSMRAVLWMKRRGGWAAVAALTAQGGQTKPPLKVNIARARAVGASREELCEITCQMTLYGGFPAMIDALNAAIEVFEAEDDG